MRIGITYDLQQDYLEAGLSEEEAAEFDRPDTIDGIEKALVGLGFRTERIGNAHRLVERLAAGHRWDMVFNIAEGVSGFGREAQVPALLEAYGIPYTFSDPLVLSLTLHKGMTKHVLRSIGVPTADFRTVRRLKDLAGVDLPFPLFAKPVAEGTGKGITAASKIRNREEMTRVCDHLLSAFRQPVMLETFLPGREFTVGITGTGETAEAVGALEILLRRQAEQDAYSFSNKKRFEDRVDYRLVEDDEARQAVAVALDAWRCLECRDGGRVDLRSDRDGRPLFLEVNPLAGLNPDISDLSILCRLAGVRYGDLIGRIMDSALARTGLSRSLPRCFSAPCGGPARMGAP